MTDTKNEYIAFMNDKYANIVLRQSVFYSCKYALRFDLRDTDAKTDNDEYFIEGLNRAKELFCKIFDDCGEFYFAYRNKKIRFSDKIFANIADLNECEIHTLKEKSIYDEGFDTNLAVIKLDISRVDYENILSSINHTDFPSRKPRTEGEVYFIHIKKEIIFNMYDDRGLDIAATNKETIEPFYKKYNKWLLDYDRKQMDKIFY